MQFTELVYIAYTEVEIIGVMQRGVFCVYKHGFLMLGHNFNESRFCFGALAILKGQLK